MPISPIQSSETTRARRDKGMTPAPRAGGTGVIPSRVLYAHGYLVQRLSAASSAITVQLGCSCRMEAGTRGVTGP